MSGNPFRPNAKRVRIQTPPPLSPDSLSPDGEDSYIQRFGPDGHSGSPPPSPFSPDSPSVSRDPFSRDFVEDAISKEAQENTRRNVEQSTDSLKSNSFPSDTSTSTIYEDSIPTIPEPQPPPSSSTANPAPESHQYHSRSVANPFRRTLANIEPQDGLRSSEQSLPSRNPAETQSAIDVDAFTKMMIGGNQQQHTNGSVHSDTSPKSQRAKPALPRHRYGRSLTNNGKSTASETPPHSPTEDTTTSSRSGPSRPLPTKNPPPPPPPRRSGTVTLRNSSGASSDQTSISETASSASPPPPGDESPPRETNPYRRYMRERSQSNASR